MIGHHFHTLESLFGAAAAPATAATSFLADLPPPPRLRVESTPPAASSPDAKTAKTAAPPPPPDDVHHRTPFSLAAEHSKTQTRQFDVSELNASASVRIVMDSFTGVFHVTPEGLINEKGAKLPDKSKCACFYCAHRFKTKPIGLPTKYDRKRNCFHLRHIFCSYSCALAFANERCGHRIRLMAGTFLVKLRSCIDGVPCSTPLLPAPHWATLKLFGGKSTITQFRKSNSRRLCAIPEELHLVPFGFNVFKLPPLRKHVANPVTLRSSRKKRNAASAKSKRVRRCRARPTGVNRNTKLNKIRLMKYGPQFSNRTLADVLK